MREGQSILLIQPRHIYAPPYSVKKEGHIYMPTSLLAAATLFIELGLNVKVVDENIEEAVIDNNIIGINLLGAPYIPETIKLQKIIETKFNDDYKLLLGGQIVSGIQAEELIRLFSKKVINGNSSKQLSKLLNIDELSIPKIENLSFINAYNIVEPKILKLYLEKEFSFYLSQGCKHACSFCSAHRNIHIKELGIHIKVKEVYRDINIALTDLEFLFEKALAFKITKLEFYLSNLDLFQSPLVLHRFAIGVIKLQEKYPSLKISFRGLSTSRSFLKTHKNYPYVIEDLVHAGLTQIGFGIDGATSRVYKATKKPQTVQESLDAIKISKENYGITPETLMVFGHNNEEDEESLELALGFCKDMHNQYGALPRPHVAKDIVPGNDGWFDKKNEGVRKEFLNNPILFQNLDFTAVPSQITHPDNNFRKLVEKYYIKVCELPNSLTQYVLPEHPNMSEIELNSVRLHNQEKYDI